MKDDDLQLPEEAKAAFEAYPRLEPSTAFNRAVIEALEHQNQRRLTLLGRIEEFLGLDLWRFAASGLLGAFVPLLILGALYFSGRSPSPVPAAPNRPDPAAMALRAMGPFYAREWEETASLVPSLKVSPRPRSDTRPNTPQSPQGGEISCVASQSHLA